MSKTGEPEYEGMCCSLEMKCTHQLTSFILSSLKGGAQPGIILMTGEYNTFQTMFSSQNAWHKSCIDAATGTTFIWLKKSQMYPTYMPDKFKTYQIQIKLDLEKTNSRLIAQ